MKKINIKLIVAAIILINTSCSDVLDKGPLDKYSENDVWSSVELTQGFIYPTLNTAVGNLIGDDAYSDNNVIQDNTGASSINREQIDSYYGNDNWNIYGSIRNCNLVIQKIEENTVFLEKDREHLKAQAKMMRAMLYFRQARLFGKLMIVDKVIDPDEDMQYPRTNTIKETYDFILKDLQEAAPHLPVTLQNKQGMLSQGAAYAFMAEIALHGAAYIESGHEEYYSIAKEASEALFALNEYELDTDYGKLFNDYDYALNSKEIILAQWRHENNTTFAGTWMQNLVPNVNNDKLKEGAGPPLPDSFEGWIGTFPSVDLVSDYEVIDKDGKAKDWDKTSYYNDYKINGGYVSKALYKDRDERFYATVVYDSTQYFNSLVTMRKWGNLHWDSKAGGDWGMALTGYMYRKGIYTKKLLWHTDPTYYHYIVMRLGRAYLNYAEAMLRLNQVDKAIEYINKTRTIHGGLPELSPGMSSGEAWKAYKRERRVELVQEGDRYWSLLRWGKADGKKVVEELNKVHQSISISEDGKTFEYIPLPYRLDQNERIFTEKRYLFPVPQGERNLNPALDQNPMW